MASDNDDADVEAAALEGGNGPAARGPAYPPGGLNQIVGTKKSGAP
jgi:hypothetical protein